MKQEKDESKKAVLAQLTTQGNQDFKNLQGKMQGLIDFLEHYGFCHSLEQLIDYSTRPAPRVYTLASSSKKDPFKVSICVSLTYDQLQDNSQKVGLASQYLIDLYNDFKRGDSRSVRVNFQKSTFYLPQKDDTPCLCISAGAGIAPFKGFQDEKIYDIDNIEDSNFGQLTFAFGCKGSQRDYLYKSELIDAKNRGCLKHLVTAFSRDQVIFLCLKTKGFESLCSRFVKC